MKQASEIRRVAVLGAGSWGTALAKHLGERGFATVLWCHGAETLEAIKRNSENSVYLPGFKLPASIHPTASIADAVKGSDMVLLVPPSHVFREIVTSASEFIADDTPVVSATKGIEKDTNFLMSDILEEVLGKPERLAYLSGPSFAKELAAGVPTAVTIAGINEDAAQVMQDVFNTSRLRVYTNNDIVGVELGGALKNVIALASGVSDGLGFGANSRAALITRGLAEISRMGVKRGANPLTFLGLAGLGDLVLTCTSTLSRNYSVGHKLGEGMTLTEILENMKMVAEGVKNTVSALGLAKELGIEMPIAEQMYSILYENKDPRQAVIDLMTRDPKNEVGSLSS